MIGWLSGTLRAKRPPDLLLEVVGVGYELQAPMTTFYGLPEVGQDAAFFIHQQVREDSINLYAFSLVEDRDVFRALLRVNGVGAKVALAVLSGMETPVLARCISAGDTASLSKIPGIGKKTAERLVVEMRDKLDGFQGGMTRVGGRALGAGVGTPDDPASEAVAALVALGFKLPEASRRVRAVEAPDLPSEEMVRLALQAAAPA